MMKYSFLAVLCCAALLAIGQDYYEGPKLPHEIGVDVSPIVATAIPAQMGAWAAELTYKYVRAKRSPVLSFRYQYQLSTKSGGRDLELVSTSGNRADYRHWGNEYHATGLFLGYNTYYDTLKKFVFFRSIRLGIGWLEHRQTYNNVFFSTQNSGWVNANTAQGQWGPEGISRANYFTVGPRVGAGFSWYPLKRVSFDYQLYLYLFFNCFINHDIISDPAGVMTKPDLEWIGGEATFLNIRVNYRFSEGN